MRPLLFLFVLTIFGCKNTETATNTVTPTPEAAHSCLALGDSYTIGTSVADSSRWSVQMVAQMRKAQIPMLDADIIARNGWTCRDLQDGIDAANNTKKYELVTLLIGVNNQYRRQDINAFRVEFRGIVQTTIGFAQNKEKKRVLVLSIPDWGVTPAGGSSAATIAADIDRFNAVEQDECNAAGVQFIDITPLSRTASGESSLVASDGLHFSGKMYRLWAEKTLPFATKVVR